MPWRPFKDKRKSLAVAIYNFDQRSDWRLSLNVGDTVTVLEECDEGWYYGKLIANTALTGIFPKNFVVPVVSETNSVISEVTSVLREWSHIFRENYVSRKEFKPLKDTMREVMSFRSSLVCGKLPAEDAKEIKKKVTAKLDFMNNHLGLDLVVRGPDGNPLDPTAVSAVTVYRKHASSSEKIDKMLGAIVEEDSGSSNEAFQILLTLKSFVHTKLLSTFDELELSLAIVEVSETKFPRPLCEPFIVYWNKKSSGGNKVLFTDICKNDIANKKLFLLCNVTAEGNYCSGLNSDGHKLPKTATKADILKLKKEINFRKAQGTAAIDISDLFTFKQGKRDAYGRETELALPFIASSGDNESLEATFKKFSSSDRKNQESNKCLWVKLNVLFGEGVDGSELSLGSCSVSRKIGLPDVILPSDLRNDFYVTLDHGEFSRLDKRQDRNVEVCLQVVDNVSGFPFGPLEKSVSPGIGSRPSNTYTSVVYYHEPRPRWNELVKVSVPVDVFSGSHLRFFFRHRSRNDTKEKSAPWAFAFLKLVSDNDGTAIKDGIHELLLYKCEKKFEINNTNYLNELPDLKLNQFLFKVKNSNNLSMLTKDSFIVRTVLCSTKLTQNEGLLSILKWRSEPTKLLENLQSFKMKVSDNGQEVVKFLPDVLDALFSILTDETQNVIKVFRILIFVIQIVADTRYSHFLPILELYIKDNFSSTLAYQHLLTSLVDCLDMASATARILTDTMKSLNYIFKFVVRSRTLFAELNGGKEQDSFEKALDAVLQDIVKFMGSPSSELSSAQEHCLKRMVESIPDLVTVFDAKDLSLTILQMIKSLPKNQLPEIKIQIIRDLVHSVLFRNSECRALILEDMLRKVREFMDDDSYAHLLPACTETLGDILDSLSNHEDMNTSFEDIQVLVSTVLRTVVQNVVKRSQNDPPNLVSILISLLRQMTPEHYSAYIQSFNASSNSGGRGDLLDFILDIFLMFRDLIRYNPFPPEWTSMILLTNSVILKALTQISYTVRDDFHSPFEIKAWNQFFEVSVSFITQSSLQLESFSENKRLKILNTYGDMRKNMGHEVYSMWFNLGQHKIRFIPRIVGPFLEMTLVPESELRRSTIPLFFDMMQCEYYSGKTPKENFHDFEREMIEKADVMLESGRGDEYFKILFRDIVGTHCENHTAMKIPGSEFVKLLVRLLELLLEYRAIVNEENKNNRMSCIVNLLEFYKTINREEMYVRYLKKLVDLHEEVENYSEAAHTLLRYSQLLSWSDSTLNSVLYYKTRGHGIRTHRDLKEQLYLDIISYFEKGRMWECALNICHELEIQYKTKTYDYPRLADLHGTMAKFYRSIMSDIRPEPEYFRVAFYGRGFAVFLRNKVFIYRGRGFEKLSDFQNRILDQFPNADLMKTLEPPTEEETLLPIQLIQINKVEPIMRNQKFKGKFIHHQILDYYKVNDVNTFMYSRPFVKEKNKDNEFASLWIDRTVMETKESFPGILQWSQVRTPVQNFQLCPLENAIENMVKTNEDLERLIREHQRANPPFNPLSMKLKGVVDAAVMGGTAKYEKAFFVDRYILEHPEHSEEIIQLQNLIAEQIPLLRVLMEVHSVKCPPELKEFHDTLDSMFEKMAMEVEEKYGKRESRFNVASRQTSTCGVDPNGSSRLSLSYDNSKSRASVFSVINGMARKKSTSTRPDSGESLRLNGDSPTVVITSQNYHQEPRFRPQSSGTSYLMPTPNHSRSPSSSSNNRDSCNSDVFYDNEDDPPPPAPPKKGRNDDVASISSFEETRLHLKKKAPPPPLPHQRN